MKNPFHNRYFRVAVSAWLVIAMSILCFFAFYKIDAIIKVIQDISVILRPFTFGFVVAYLLLPIFNSMVKRCEPVFLRMMRNQEKAKNVNRLLCSLLSVVFFLFVVGALLSMVLPQLAESVVGLIEKMPEYLAQSEKWMTNLFSNNPILEENLQQLYMSASDTLLNWANEQLVPQLLKVMKGNLVGSFVSNALSFMKTVLVGFISAVYMLNSKHTFSAQAKKLIYSMFETDTANAVLENFRFIHKVFGGFITGKLLDSLIIGLITFVSMSILQLPYVLLISVIIGVTNIIPFFGPFIGAIPSTILIFLVSPLQAVYFVIFIFILQQFDGNILGPKILGDSTGLASFWVMFAILLFGGLFGFAGMVVGVPLFAVIYSTISGLVNRSLRNKHISTDTSAYMTLDHVDAESKEIVPITAESVAPTEVKLERFKRRMDKNEEESSKP
ncbi:MAG: AI-2E family transporter [Butyricicoccus pullicaecorum]|nr:AI-2E family transporter [Butyricicoccus pullicaecorum]